MSLSPGCVLGRMLPSAIGPPGRNLSGEGSHPVLLDFWAPWCDTLVGRVPKAVIADRLRALRD